MIYTDLAFMEGIVSTCEICEGKRFKPEVLAYHLRGKTISDVLEMTVEEALAFFTEKKIKPVLQAMNDVGLGYLKLGQPLSTLSGGECQRLKLATELHKAGQRLRDGRADHRPAPVRHRPADGASSTGWSTPATRSS